MIHKVMLQDYKQFTGHQEMILSKKTTLILGWNRSGKKDLFEAIKEGVIATHPTFSVEYHIPDIEHVRDLIFVGEEDLLEDDFPDKFSYFFDKMDNKERQELDQLVLPMIEKQLVPEGFSGKCILSNFSYLLSLRAVTETANLPLVLDFPFSRLAVENHSGPVQIIDLTDGQLLIFYPLGISRTGDYSVEYTGHFNRIYILAHDEVKKTTRIKPYPLFIIRNQSSSLAMKMNIYELTSNS